MNGLRVYCISPISFSSRSEMNPKTLSLSQVAHVLGSLRDDIVVWIRRWDYTSQNITHRILNSSHWVNTAFPLFAHIHRGRFMIRSILPTLIIITPNRQWDTGSCLTQEMEWNGIELASSWMSLREAELIWLVLFSKGGPIVARCVVKLCVEWLDDVFEMY